MRNTKPRCRTSSVRDLGHTQFRSRRRGSALLVVIALTGMLALLGVMFFSFASQELENSRNFNRAAAELDNPENPASVYFNFALKQIIQGSDPSQKNSALYGPRHSIVGNMLGFDSHPFNGLGVSLGHHIDTSSPFEGDNITFEPRIYLNGRPNTPPGAAGTGNWWNDPQVLLGFNDSPSANYDSTHPNPSFNAERNPAALPAPDVDYTYPDLNNVFLAYRGFTRDPQTGARLLVIKPSYHRPEVLAALEPASLLNEDTNGNSILDPGEDTNSNGLLDILDFDRDGVVDTEDVDDNGAVVFEDNFLDGVFQPAVDDSTAPDPDADGFFDVEDLNQNSAIDPLILRDPHWAYNGWTKNRVMRPHPGHIAYVVDPQTRTSVATSQWRFIDDDTTDAGDLAILAGLPGGSGGFQFRVDLDGDGRFNEQGVWSRSRPVQEEDTNQNGILDVGEDLNSNGILDTNVFEYEFDVDNDNDGQLDGILMDLDYKPEQRPSDGALYVPLFSATIYDFDGLFNLNIHGNLSGDTSPSSSTVPFGGGASISQSLYGLSASEINPIWGLSGHPGQEVDAASLSDYTTYFDRTPPSVNVADSGPLSLAKQVELANMAWWWLNKGGVEFTTPLPIINVGRLGEEDRIWQVYQAAGSSNLIALNSGGSYASFPSPGIAEGAASDDNGNFNEGGPVNGVPGLPDRRPFRHPISFSGTGSFADPADSSGNTPRLHQISGSQVRVPEYVGFGIAGDVGYRTLLSAVPPHPLLGLSGAGVLGYPILGAGPDGFLFTSDDVRGVPANDMMEMTLEDLASDRWSVLENSNESSQGVESRRSALTVADEPFSLDDAALLQLAAADVVNTGVTSRLTKLLPSHFDPANNSRAVTNRQMFATHTWDRRQFGLSQTGTGLDEAPGDAGTDDDGDGVIDNFTELGWPGTDDLRAWEFNTDIDGDGLPEFPPQFSSGGVPAYAGYPGSPVQLPNLPSDPFRPEVRQLLHVERGNTDPNQFAFQFRLSINHILDSVRVDPQSRPLAIEFRDLTPHPNSGVTDIPEIANGAGLPAYPPQNATQQEWWARYDRQRMARDIYVTLYTLCGSNFSGNTLRANSGTTPIYSEDDMREMAQFAVNVVDSLDRDDAHTMFEYDTNLFDGWGLNDQAWDTTGDMPAQLGQRRVVYGVEEQQLAFSEALWAFQDDEDAGGNALTTNDPATTFDETAKKHHFLFWELQNVSARRAALTAPSGSTSPGTAVWRIRRKFAVTTSRVAAIGTVEAARTSGAIPAGEEAMYFRNGAGSVAPGDMYTVGTCDKYDPAFTTHPCTFYFDDDGDNTYEAIIPRDGTTISGTPPTLPATQSGALDLDMTFTAPGGTSPYGLVNAPTQVGGFLDESNAPRAGSAAEEQLVLVLERRLNPELNSLSIAENPWVTVDAIFVPREELQIEDADPLLDKVKRLVSQERPEPLAAAYQDPFNDDTVTSGTPADRYQNTIHTNPIAGDGLNSRSQALKQTTTANRIPYAPGQTAQSRTPFVNFHRHLNRDFTSMAELFSLPLRGPKTLPFVLEFLELAPDDQHNLSQSSIFTTKLGVMSPARAPQVPAEYDEDRDNDHSLDSGEDLNGDTTNDYDEDQNGNGQLDTGEDVGTRNFQLAMTGEDFNGNGLLETHDRQFSASAKFLLPRHPGVGGGTVPNANFHNHWHRLLGFFEVPTRAHRQLSPDTLLLTRLPGKVNFNTIRHPEVLGGMIDDASIATPPERDINGNGMLDPFEDFNQNGVLDRGLRVTAGLGRDYWFDFLQSRDGLDPVSYLVLPGTSSSKPFRGLTNSAGALQSDQTGLTGGRMDALASSMLRRHPRSQGGANRLLFEMGTNTDSNNGVIDTRSRYRLLSKLMNNATTRSNVFYVFLSVQFHEAHQDPVTGAVRIGGRFDLDGDGDVTNDGHRGFFIIDRSDVERSFTSNEFNWRDLVKYELEIN